MATMPKGWIAESVIEKMRKDMETWDKDDEFPICRGCGKPARYQNYTGRAYCGRECGACWEEDRLQVPEAETRKRISDREIAEWNTWLGEHDVSDYRANAEEVIASWRRWAETGDT